MSRFKLLYFVIFIINLYNINAQISDKRLCVDEKCTVPISEAKTLLRYSSPDSRILSFTSNADVTIYSKSAGSNIDLWGGEINGKRGYVPKHLVRETKILKKPSILVDTELKNDTDTNQQVPSHPVEPNKVQEPYEVVDGTTIYLNPQEGGISPSSTESPIQSTALPVSDNTPNEQTETDTLHKEPVQIPPEEAATDPPEEATIAPSEKAAISPPGDAAINPPDMLSKISDWISDATGQSEDDEEDGDETEEDDDEDGDEEDDLDFEDLQTEQKTEKEPEIPAAEVKNEEIVNTESLPEKSIEEKVDEPLQAESSELPEEKVDEPLQAESSELPEEEIDKPLQAESSELPKENVPSLGAEAQAIGNTVDLPLDSQIIPENIPLQSEQPLPDESILNDDKSEENNTNSLQDQILNTTQSQSEEIANDELSTEQPIATLEQKAAPIVEEQIAEESIQATNDSSTKEITLNIEAEVPTKTIAPIEFTTPSSAFEEPYPIHDEVTENPTVVSSEQPPPQEIPTLPPYSLFGKQPKAEDVQIQENSSSEEVPHENVPLDNPDTLEEPTLEAAVTVEEQISSSVEEVAQPAVEETAENFESAEEDSPSIFSGMFAFFGKDSAANEEQQTSEETLEQSTSTANGEKIEKDHVQGDNLVSKHLTDTYETDATSCDKKDPSNSESFNAMDILSNFNPDIFLYLVTTAVSVLIFLFGYIAFDKNKREGPLVAKINKLEKELLIQLKENENLENKTSAESGYEEDAVSSELVENLKYELTEVTQTKLALEEQIQSLEKELENSTEVGMELNRMLSEILSSESGSDGLKANVEHLQRQLVEQHDTINSINETLAITNTENHELNLQLELSNKKVVDLQTELDKLLQNILNIEEEKDQQQATLEGEVESYRKKYQEIYNKYVSTEQETSSELSLLKKQLKGAERNLELKTKEHETLQSTISELKFDKNTVKSLLEATSIKAELQVLQAENKKLVERLQNEEDARVVYEKRAQAASEECQLLKTKYDEADKLKLETETKLEVLSNYFKDKEAQLQKEISKHESLWVEKQGEASSTTERIKFMQEQLQNYKEQTESLKQEIMNQEVELKSQISVLEKKAHENWVGARQAERKLEDAKQEAAQLRHRLTLRERAIQEEKGHRLQSPIEQNGEMPTSPASPPLLYSSRDHITKSPPIPGLPPFLPPPPGAPFMPPPMHGVPPFLPPPPAAMFPGDHRPPPLGRMSSPPINRYSPSSRGYSPYDRNSSSPSDSEYGTSPPQRRGYSPFNSRGERDYKRPPIVVRSNGRKGMANSSASGNSNESLEKINNSRHNNKV